MPVNQPLPLQITLPPTPTLADATMLGEGYANYTVLNSRLCVQISGSNFEFGRGSIVALHRSVAKQLVSDGMITVA